MYELELESDGYSSTGAAQAASATEDLGARGAAAGALIGGAFGLGVAAYAGYELGDYVNERYLPDAGSLPHLLVDVAGIGVGLSVLGAPLFYGGAFVGGVVGGALGERTRYEGP